MIDVFKHTDGRIPIFTSLDAFLRYMLAMRDLSQKEKRPSSRGVD